MYKIKWIKFYNHPILGDLFLDFRDLSGEAVSTIIIAGENGTGKSTVLDALFSVVNFGSKEEISIAIDEDGQEVRLDFRWNDNDIHEYLIVDNNLGLRCAQADHRLKRKYKFQSLFSDVDINFTSDTVKTVTSEELDSKTSKQRSTAELPTQIKQLIVDIQSSDDADTAESYRNALQNGGGMDDVREGTRMHRFTKAFNKMFDGLSYDKVENNNGKKSILFKKNGVPIDIDALSSGEKQIVFRGCFLLRDKVAMEGAFVFIDEPEISLHPNWQKKILDYYKDIFTDEFGKQTSQIFIVTHSPFIIHNENRKNDKVIVLKRNDIGEIEVCDKPEYYCCDNTLPIVDAFNIMDFEVDLEKSHVYLEGRTDEMYFNRAKEIFSIADSKIEFNWVGHIKKDGNEEFTGSSSLNQAVKFMKGRRPNIPQFFVFDCDTKKAEDSLDNVITITMPKYDNSGVMNKGIENTLVLEDINLDPFYKEHTVTKDYGNIVTTREFDKIEFAEYICSLDIERQKKILINLKPIIDRIIAQIDMSKRSR